jgi:hypothetical protein
MTRVTRTLSENLYTFMIPRSFLRRMRNVSDESCRENQNTYFILNNVFKKIWPFKGYIKNNTAQPDTLRMAVK